MEVMVPQTEPILSGIPYSPVDEQKKQNPPPPAIWLLQTLTIHLLLQTSFCTAGRMPRTVLTAKAAARTRPWGQDTRHEILASRQSGSSVTFDPMKHTGRWPHQLPTGLIFIPLPLNPRLWPCKQPSKKFLTSLPIPYGNQLAKFQPG